MDSTLLPIAQRLGITPDQVTVTGLLLSTAAGAAYVFSPPAGALLLLAAGSCDILDGHLARTGDRQSPAGAFLDSVLDRYGEIAVMAGIWGYLYRQNDTILLASVLVFAAVTGSLLVSYTRARGEGLGASCSEGLFQRTTRILLLITAGLLAPTAPGIILPAGIGIIAVGAHLTAVGRIVAIRRTLTDRKQEERFPR